MKLVRLPLFALVASALAGFVHADAMDNIGTTRPASSAASTSLSTASTELPMADRVVVYKGQRRMLLMRGDSILRTYKISLGLNPIGHKERSGDFRTPEGRYLLTRRNPRSDFFLSIQVSYPNEADIAHARRNGWDTGGAIMIHGLPNQLKHAPSYYENRDWTDGCIAVSNSDMVEIWLLTAPNTPIEILP
ncbi:MAG: L,D-transpeptidase family protein [Steroidobacteraceae bacterium]|jgi:murein L,D-transpeptidase YafK|nr:L,D-transpeptidase family protein [Steroidobacteraceae bacterium]